MIVIDASAAIEVLLDARSAASITEFLDTDQPQLGAPHLIDLEIIQVLRRHLRNRALSHERAREAVADWQAFPVLRYPHDDLLSRVFEMRDNATSYDAVYIALAEALNAPLLTHDAKLKTVPGHNVKIMVM